MVKLEDLKPGQGICIKSGDPRRYLVGRLGYLGKSFMNGAPEGHVVVSFDYEVDHTCSHGVALENLELVDLDIVIKAMLDLRVGVLDPQGLLEAAKRAWPDPLWGMDKYELLLEFLTTKYAYDFERWMKRDRLYDFQKTELRNDAVLTPTSGVGKTKSLERGSYAISQGGDVLVQIVAVEEKVVHVKGVVDSLTYGVPLHEFKERFHLLVRGEWA